jgi:hypothetical protein
VGGGGAAVAGFGLVNVGQDLSDEQAKQEYDDS